MTVYVISSLCSVFPFTTNKIHLATMYVKQFEIKF